TGSALRLKDLSKGLLYRPPLFTSRGSPQASEPPLPIIRHSGSRKPFIVNLSPYGVGLTA
ncbi:MAG: hypothetical protein PHP01_04105, partial [Phycisphaerae bacterium]|nr:hypothetical protein [Phycisphaerae bacterium]